MSSKFYTILIVPDRSSKVRRIKISKRLLAQCIFGLCLLFGIASFMVVHYLYVVDQVTENKRLRQENIKINNFLQVSLDRMERIDSTLERIEGFDVQLREITRLNDPERSLAMGPIQPGQNRNKILRFEGESTNRPAEPIDSKMAMHLLDARMESLDKEAKYREGSLRELQEYFEDQKSLLSTTPSISPTKGWLTSLFGLRNDPYTGKRTYHKGLDIAAAIGTTVRAPSEGTVIFLGNRGSYGKTLILDHGYGVQTHYGHLSQFLVKVGNQVKRGELVAKVGNTGRSTGPHLHYEVRVFGIPQNPRKYILEGLP